MAASRVDVAARLRGLLGWGRWLALPLGGLLALAFAPSSHYLLAFACPAALFVLWHGASPREAAWRGFLFTAGTFLAGTYWLYHSIHLVGQAPVWVALLLMLGHGRDHGRRTPRSSVTSARAGHPPRGALRWLFLLPALWVLSEWLRGWFLSGFPWLALGYSAARDPLARLRAAARRLRREPRRGGHGGRTGRAAARRRAATASSLRSSSCACGAPARR